jgi:hypothetical protein
LGIFYKYPGKKPELLAKWNFDPPKLIYIPLSQEEEDELQKLKEKVTSVEYYQLGRNNKVLEISSLLMFTPWMTME